MHYRYLDVTSDESTPLKGGAMPGAALLTDEDLLTAARARGQALPARSSPIVASTRFH
jgi:hypothetical protein